ncbi:Lrp/AsnC family transcriptional regulator [Halopiger djelfimassiliensis]|uniref:Lrp/AsnC family transcriptional regulator n=1 Tax=Halopiger djelfimassiliensis TaxID=1293047 RepID=UPI000677D998|nr:Lrp/AsnC ligand binding domain-containing protein [Halopiger djelfimassiliensis]
MTDAYVNILADAGAVSAVADEIGGIDAVSTVHVVTGEYDVIAQLELDDPDDLPAVVADEIHTVSGVVDTVTNVAFEP